MADIHMSPSARIVLIYLQQHGPNYAAHIAAHTSLAVSTVPQALRWLRIRGYVVVDEIKPSPTLRGADRIYFRLTELGCQPVPQHSLPRNQALTLKVMLDHAGPLHGYELTRRTNIDNSPMYSLLAKLVEAGLIEVAPPAAGSHPDARIYYVLTESGQQAAGEIVD